MSSPAWAWAPVGLPRVPSLSGQERLGATLSRAGGVLRSPCLRGDRPAPTEVRVTVSAASRAEVQRWRLRLFGAAGKSSVCQDPGAGSRQSLPASLSWWLNPTDSSAVGVSMK